MVIDTMVLSYALLGVTKHRDEALDLLQVMDRIIVPDLARAELANVMWQWVKNKEVPVEVAVAALEDADAILEVVLPTNLVWTRALELSLAADHPVYDTVFVACAERMGTKLVSYDGRLRRKFARLTVAPDKALAELAR